MRKKLKEYSRRFFSVFLCIFIFCFFVISPVSASSYSSSSDNYKVDLTPYLDYSYLSLDGVRTYPISFILDDPLSFEYIDFVFETDSRNFRIYTYSEYLTVVKIGDSLYRAFGNFSISEPQLISSIYLVNSDSSASYFNVLNSYVYSANYLTTDIPISYSVDFSYYHKHYLSNSESAFNRITDNISISNSINVPSSVDFPLLHSNTADFSIPDSWAFNEGDVFVNSFLYFNWTKFDRVDLFFYNGFDSINDYSFYVDSINVLSSVQSVLINGSEATIVSLDFSDLNPAVNSPTCYLRFRGYKTLNSSTTYQMFFIHKITGFTKTVSNNFWPTWLNKIIDKLDNIFTGRTQDQSAANSFNDSINDQSNELEDLTADLNSVTRPPLTDVNLSTGTMVDSGTIVLATSGLGSIMSNTIILRVLLMALTFALAGFILFGKR